MPCVQLIYVGNIFPACWIAMENEMFRCPTMKKFELQFFFFFISSIDTAIIAELTVAVNFLFLIGDAFYVTVSKPSAKPRWAELSRLLQEKRPHTAEPQVNRRYD